MAEILAEDSMNRGMHAEETYYISEIRKRTAVLFEGTASNGDDSSKGVVRIFLKKVFLMI